MELWNVLFSVLVQNAKDKSPFLASPSFTSVSAAESAAASVVALLEEPHPANIAAIIHTERPAAVNLRLFFMNLILLFFYHSDNKCFRSIFDFT